MSINLRVPSDLHDELKRLAQEEDRTLTAQIIRLLRQALRAQSGEAKTPPSAE